MMLIDGLKTLLAKVIGCLAGNVILNLRSRLVLIALYHYVWPIST